MIVATKENFLNAYRSILEVVLFGAVTGGLQ